MAFRPVPYSQNDPVWKNVVLGPGPDTIGWIGCTMTCLAMYASGWGYPETPASMNRKLTAHGGFTSGEDLIWTAVSQFIPQIKYRNLMFCNDTTNHIALIDAELARGNPVIVEVDFAPDATLQTHWVLLYARKQGEDDYLMLDPYPCPPENPPVSIMSRYGRGQPLKRVIRVVAFYDCDGAAPGPDPTSSTTTSTTPSTTPSTPATPSTPPVPVTPSTPPTPSTPLPTPVTTDLVVQVLAEATAGIKLHDAPSMESFAAYAEMPGVRLNVIEPKAGALAKLGQSNQWVFVRDPNGHQGFVAAWFVQAVSAPATSPAPIPATPPSTPSAPSTPPASPGPSTTPSTPPASGPQRMQVQVVSTVGMAGLAVRQQPSPGATMVNVEKAGARLTVVEPLDGARAKIGKTGQWLAVKATNNKRGYVMAQYVQAR